MSIRYLQSGDEPAGSLLNLGWVDDGGDSWWAGAQRCFASVAIATALVSTALSAAIASEVQQDAEEIPAGSLKKFSTPDEDFWSNPTAPFPATISQPLPYAIGEPAEMFPQTVLPPDEDFWRNPVAPVAGTNYQPLPYLPDVSDDPAGSLVKASGLDEDYWALCVQGTSASFAAAAWNIFQCLPYLPDPSDEPAQFHGILLEWYAEANATSSVGYNIYRALASGQEGSTPLNPAPVSVGASPGSLCAYADTTIQWGVPYYYYVCSIDTSTQTISSPSSQISASFPPTVDEDFWSNLVPPSAPANFLRLPYLPDPDEVPAGHFAKFTSPDEDYWTNLGAGGWGLGPAGWGFAPGGKLAVPFPQLPYLPDVDEIPAGSLYAVPEEFYWQNPVAPASLAIFQRLPYLPDPEEIPAGGFAKFATPDEDFWPPFAQAPGGGQTAPAQWTLYQPLPYLPDAEEIPAGKLLGLVEELYWQNPVAPIAAANFQRLPYLPDPDEIPAGALAQFSTPDEDFWQNPVPSSLFPVPFSIFQRLPYLPDPDEIPAASLIKLTTPDEDYWTNPVAPAQWTISPPPLYCPDPQDEPAQFHWIVLNWLADPTASSTCGYNIYRAPISGGGTGFVLLNSAPVDVGAAPNSPCTYTDSTIQWGVFYYYYVCTVDTSDGLVSSPSITIEAGYPPIVDEDFWWNPAAPVVAAIYQPLPYLPDLSDDPAGALKKFPTPDEDFWTNPAAPAQWTLFQPLPYAAGESAEILPLPVLPPDEDFWLSLVPPAPAAIYQRLPYLPDPEELPAASLYGVPEETEWRSGVAPLLASIYQQLPYASGETGEAIPPPFVPDEDYWQNLVGAVREPPLRLQFPYLPELSDEPAGSLYIPPCVPDEDFWTNQVAPAQVAMNWSQPSFYGFDDFISYWSWQTWMVNTRSAARGRLSRSTPRSRTSRGASRKSLVVG